MPTELKTYRPALNNYRSHCVWAFGSRPKYVYVAASVANQTSALRLAMQLQRAGLEVTSRWLEFDFSTYAEMNPFIHTVERERCETWGKRDLEDLERADTLVLLADVPSSKGGFHVELGFMLGKGRNVLVIGERPNVFYWTDEIRFLASLDGVVDFLMHPDHGKVPQRIGEYSEVIE